MESSTSNNSKKTGEAEVGQEARKRVISQGKETKLLPAIADALTPAKIRERWSLKNPGKQVPSSLGDDKLNSIRGPGRKGVQQNAFIKKVGLIAPLFPEIFDGKTYKEVAENSAALDEPTLESPILRPRVEVKASVVEGKKDRSRGAGFRFRLTLAVVIAAIALFSLYSRNQSEVSSLEDGGVSERISGGNSSEVSNKRLVRYFEETKLLSQSGGIWTSTKDGFAHGVGGMAYGDVRGISTLLIGELAASDRVFEVEASAYDSCEYGIVVASNSNGRGVYFGVIPSASDDEMVDCFIEREGSRETLCSTITPWSGNYSNCNLSVKLANGSYTLYLDGTEVYSFTESDSLSSVVGLFVSGNPKSTVNFRFVGAAKPNDQQQLPTASESRLAVLPYACQWKVSSNQLVSRPHPGLEHWIFFEPSSEYLLQKAEIEFEYACYRLGALATIIEDKTTGEMWQWGEGHGQPPSFSTRQTRYGEITASDTLLDIDEGELIVDNGFLDDEDGEMEILDDDWGHLRTTFEVGKIIASKDDRIVGSSTGPEIRGNWRFGIRGAVEGGGRLVVRNIIVRGYKANGATNVLWSGTPTGTIYETSAPFVSKSAELDAREKIDPFDDGESPWIEELIRDRIKKDASGG